MPIKKERAKAHLRLLSLRATNKGTKAIQARNSKSNLGNDRISNRADSRAKRTALKYAGIVTEPIQRTASLAINLDVQVANRSNGQAPDGEAIRGLSQKLARKGEYPQVKLKSNPLAQPEHT